MCHWIAANVSVPQMTVSILPMPIFETEELGELIEYKPPGPPKTTGKHRYIFLVSAPRNGATEPLYSSKPKDRQHWGTGEESGGVKNWAREKGLVPVAANLIYSQHKKYRDH
ncbi:hypothetical protein PMIN06_003789 [Paraphaeosphaeria minitans]|uniref:Phosphatidylethanolamine-binding protein n=1 Tax=Paraphaeosphaeria minitans TaxID=565426 RepID=A0A9P6GKR5_9PLEO|nr:phosphatidylethanolamine-binding protein [Paraphaeosphaeria minitans]